MRTYTIDLDQPSKIRVDPETSSAFPFVVRYEGPAFIGENAYCQLNLHAAVSELELQELYAHIGGVLGKAHTATERVGLWFDRSHLDDLADALGFEIVDGPSEPDNLESRRVVVNSVDLAAIAMSMGLGIRPKKGVKS